MTHGGARKGSGRPAIIGPLVVARMPEWQVDLLHAYAEQQGITRAEAVRRLVAAGLGAPYTT